MGQKPEALLVPVGTTTWAGFMLSFHLAFPYPLALSSVQGKVSQPCLHGHPVKVHSAAVFSAAWSLALSFPCIFTRTIYPSL